MQSSHMRLAIQQAREQGSVFGAVIAMGDQAVVDSVPTSESRYDPTGHAILMALRKIGELTHQFSFSGYQLYTTVEPCPMCASACVWSQVDAIYYGIKQSELSTPSYPGSTTARDIIYEASHSITFEGGLLEDECLKLL